MKIELGQKFDGVEVIKIIVLRIFSPCRPIAIWGCGLTVENCESVEDYYFRHEDIALCNQKWDAFQLVNDNHAKMLSNSHKRHYYDEVYFRAVFSLEALLLPGDIVVPFWEGKGCGHGKLTTNSP
ncbi:MAG TPA: hypothetical protein VJH63_01265 [Candidatus Paceibacterota bacterium]